MQLKLLNMNMTFVFVLIALLLVTTAISYAEYGEEWSVEQNYYESGILYFDYNHDGSFELTKQYFNTVTVFNGANQYEVLWRVVSENHDELIIWDIYDMPDEDETVLFIASEFVDQATSSVVAYDLLGANPLWRSDDYPGYYSFLAVDNLDADAEKEVVLGMNEYDYDEERYNSRFIIFDGSNGEIEYESPDFEGYMVGPYLGNMDNDETVEILFNLYKGSDSTSTLHVFSFLNDANISQDNLLPGDIQLRQNFPNPFNHSTIIPIHLTKSTEVKIKVYDLHGRLVANIMDGLLGVGYHQFAWDGRSDNGKMVQSGACFYEIQFGENRFRKPMTLIK